ncbi:hypothetical protein [Parabacteroides sp. PF5-6]|uniref:hypothetical protein n=1 Tax=Parabacteroides sp. PF5-6 TaxID=1742403 RepID=UPI0024063624|nr:hypothetical protein [Parabacteroides sp. PF5-6]MDF9830836.1 hypothetical protein [Parabacteroides sp. PF5-6]
MSTTTLKKKKLIEMNENTFRSLSIMAAKQGTNLKRYIENLLSQEAEKIDDKVIYDHLLNSDPEGKEYLNAQETKDLENWLGI